MGNRCYTLMVRSKMLSNYTNLGDLYIDHYSVFGIYNALFSLNDRGYGNDWFKS
jgi:hypothetical protein